LSSLTLLALTRALERPTRGRIASWGIAAALALAGSVAYGLDLVAKQDLVGYGATASVLEALDLLVFVLLGIAMLRPLGDRERSVVAFAAGLGIAAIAGAVLAALAGSDYIIVRNMLPVWPLLAVIIAVLLGGARSGRVGLLGVGGIVALSIFSWSTLQGEPQLQRADWRGAAEAIGAPTVTRAIVSNDVAALSLAPYIPFASYPSAGARIKEIDVLSPLGAWLGPPVYQLRPAPPPAGFRVADRIRTKTYVVVRYRARTPRLERPRALDALYPGLRSALVLPQQPATRP
jgi:hypothetical protein